MGFEQWWEASESESTTDSDYETMMMPLHQGQIKLMKVQDGREERKHQQILPHGYSESERSDFREACRPPAYVEKDGEDAPNPQPTKPGVHRSTIMHPRDASQKTITMAETCLGCKKLAESVSRIVTVIGHHAELWEGCAIQDAEKTNRIVDLEKNTGPKSHIVPNGKHIWDLG
jgi:hypothetical protein